MLYLEETYKLIPGKKSEFVQGVQEEFLQVAEELGLRLVGFWEYVEFQGPWPQVIGLWEFDNWEALFRKICKRRYDDPVQRKRYEKWLDKLSNWVTEKKGKILAPSHLDLTLEQLVKKGFKARAALHEDMHLFPGKQQAYPEYVKRFNGPIFEKLAFPYFFNYIDRATNTECINYAGAESWDTYAIWKKYKFGYDELFASYFGGKGAVLSEEPEVKEWLQTNIDYLYMGGAFRDYWEVELLNGLFGPLCE